MESRRSSASSSDSETSPSPSAATLYGSHGPALRGRPSIASFSFDSERSDSDHVDHLSSKSSLNLSTFSQRISEAAAVAHKYTAKSSKMFNKTKPEFKASFSRKKADAVPSARRQSVERSPLTTTSKELDRIAALGSPTTAPGQSPQHFPLNTLHHHHHHHLTFRKKDSPSSVLSSSASNSKLASEGSVYTFQTAPSLSSVKPLNFKSHEESMQLQASSWSLLTSRTACIFSEAQARIPFEDCNRLVSMYLSGLVSSGGSCFDVVDRLMEYLTSGLGGDRSLVQANDDSFLGAFVAAWVRFYTKQLTSLEAVFLPLQLELEGAGPIFNSQEQAIQFWEPLRRERRTAPVSVRYFVLQAYRDVLVLPVLPRLAASISSNYGLDPAAESISATVCRILQCINTLALVETGDASQQNIEKLVEVLKSSWITRSRQSNRQGMVFRADKGAPGF